MNKYIFLISFGIICFSSIAQQNKLPGVWISPISNDYIFIMDSFNTETFCSGSSKRIEHGDCMTVLASNDTLSFVEIYGDGTIHDRYTFKLVEVNDSILILKPISDLSRKLYKDKSTLKFIKQGYLIDKNINFEKLIVKITFEWYPPPYATYLLEFDNNKKVKLTTKNIHEEDLKTELDSERNGQFVGVINDSVYNQFQYDLQTCNLKNILSEYFVWWDIDINDIQLDYLIIDFNGQRKIIDEDNYTVTRSLHDLLVNIIFETPFYKVGSDKNEIYKFLSPSRVITTN